MKIVKRGLLPNERTYVAQCTYCETEVEFIGAEAVNHKAHRFAKSWKMIGCPVCERTIKTEFKRGYRANQVLNQS